MFSLLHGFYEELTYVPERHVALLGLESCGKSSIFEWMKSYFSKDARPGANVPRPNRLDKVSPTVGLNVAKLKTCGERLLVWDLGGAKPLRSIWERYIEEAEAIIWVVDASDEERLEESKETLRALVSRPNLIHRPLLVFANKQDLDKAIDPVKVSLALDLLLDAENRPQCVQPCSADKGTGIRDGIEWLMNSLQGNSKLEIRIP